MAEGAGGVGLRLSKKEASHYHAWWLDSPCRAYPIEQYPCRTKASAAIMHMIMNNLDPAVAQVTDRETEAWGPALFNRNVM